MQNDNNQGNIIKSADLRIIPSEIKALSPEIISYSRGETLSRPHGRGSYLAYIVSGMVHLVYMSESGKKSIVEYYSQGDLIPEIIFESFIDRNCYLVCKAQCLVTYVKGISFTQAKSGNDSFFIELQSKSDFKAITHNIILQQNSIREKLLAYFKYVSDSYRTRSFTLPFSVSDLADYISADRSAMSREIKHLNDEGILTSHRNKIILIRDI